MTPVPIPLCTQPSPTASALRAGLWNRVLKPQTFRFGQVTALEDRGGARATRLVLDGAHTPAAAAALAGTLRRAFPDAALALVVGMAADKDAAGVMAALRQAAPVAVAFTQAPIAGGLARCGSMAQRLR